MTGEPAMVELELVPAADDRVVGACCSLGADDLRTRLADWRALTERAARVERLDTGVLLILEADEPLEEVSRLVALESACCPFYRFSIETEPAGPCLTIDAGPGNGEAVVALLGLD